jgi:hypothetical protein
MFLLQNKINNCDIFNEKESVKLLDFYIGPNSILEHFLAK